MFIEIYRLPNYINTLLINKQIGQMILKIKLLDFLKQDDYELILVIELVDHQNKEELF